MRSFDTLPTPISEKTGRLEASIGRISLGLPVTLRDNILILLTVLVCTVYMGSVLKRGWYPHDEGTLAQSAERVLYGEIPHKNFDEIYTGGLTFLNAAAFHFFGTNLVALRYVSFVVFLV